MIIDANNIESLIRSAESAQSSRLRSALDLAKASKGLSLEDASIIICAKDPEARKEAGKIASEVKERVFGKRVVLFAPLYLSNYCTNACAYCGFSSANKGTERAAISAQDASNEAERLESMGFKRVLLVTGEDNRYGLDYIISAVRAIYDKTKIRIVHVNAPPMDIDGFKRLKASGVGVYQSFQETYHEPTYRLMHPKGPKRDFAFRLDTMDRAIEGGFEDVGIGPLFGLHDWRFECLSTIAHSQHLFEKFGTHAHTISIPRLRPAAGSAIVNVPSPVSDDELKLIVSVLRLSIPSAGVVISTREPEELRSELLHVGATQMSAGSRTNPGGYAGKDSLEQFSTNDRRDISEVMASIVNEGLLPSLCTSCYRSGRVGEVFTKTALNGDMEPLCQANALLSLKEHLLDHSKNGDSAPLEKALQRGIDEIADPGLKKAILERMDELSKGKRDVRL